MRHNKDRKSLNRTASHRKAMLANMVTSLFRYERIQTSKRKAKEARRVAERLITYAKKGDLASRRQAARIIRDKNVLKKLFDSIGPRYEDRQGGYTRVLKMARRNGDNTDMALLELLPEKAKKRSKKGSRKTYRKIEIPEDPVKAAEAKRREEAKKEEEAQAAEAEKKAEEKAQEEAEDKAVEEEKAEAEEDVEEEKEKEEKAEEDGGENEDVQEEEEEEKKKE